MRYTQRTLHGPRTPPRTPTARLRTWRLAPARQRWRREGPRRARRRGPPRGSRHLQSATRARGSSKSLAPKAKQASRRVGAGLENLGNHTSGQGVNTILQTWQCVSLCSLRTRPRGSDTAVRRTVALRRLSSGRSPSRACFPRGVTRRQGQGVRSHLSSLMITLQHDH